MGTTTFSGPIKAGTIKETTGTTLGSDIKNTGQVVMAQTFSVDLSGGAVAAQVTDVVIPANSQIIDCVIDVITAANTSTNLSVGDTVGGAATILNTFASGTDCGTQIPDYTSRGGVSMARHRHSGYSFNCHWFCFNKCRFSSFYNSVSAKQ